ncbi:hypothetical protein K32_26130 [Kaistia sp. 32K]|uniref:ABC transporter ATP-binding protein n=1 Tax=Kaistia sp. 32K TaxID=2795690 RepID=UPI0019155878|nr:ATP-binding cassette domain-containing protein [Kaistia sp. 32K]BCP53996.1 hypothetical protein K32_26130 [Kaistia sp. 32K]
MTETPTLVRLRQICFRVGSKDILEDIDLEIRAGETFGLVGPSGSGKSTVGRIILGLLRQTYGEVFYDGKKLDFRWQESGAKRSEIQMIFQNPLAAFNPRRQIGESLELPIRNFGVTQRGEMRDRIAETLTQVGLDPRFAMRYPHELSGGQCQRAGIARALVSRPRFIFLDEPLSALDVSVQAQVANLLKDLQASLGLTYLFVANNLLMGRYMSDRVAVLDKGRVIESGAVDQIFEQPEHPFTRRLINASLSARHHSSHPL